MRNSEQLSLYFADQLPALLIAHPTFKFIGLKINQEGKQTLLHSIYIEKEDVSDELPFRALLTVAEWQGRSEEEELRKLEQSSVSLLTRLAARLNNS